jgi:hypothetical protein
MNKKPMKSKDTGKADYSYWLLIRQWSASEAAALLMGYEPGYTIYFPEFEWPTDEPEPDDVHRTAISREREKLEKVLESAQLAGELGKVQVNEVGKPWGKTVTATQWIKWAERNNIECAAELLAAYEQMSDKPEKESGEIHPRTETSLLRIIGALLEQLTENTNQSQAAVIREIVDLHGHKDGISKATLENNFSEAKQRLNFW